MNVDAGLLRELGVELLVVFGSRARGTASASSDIDVGLLFAPGRSRDSVEDVRDAFEDRDRLDLVSLDDADPLLLREAAVDGRPLFESGPGVFEEFRVRALKRYWDTAWLRRLEADALRARYG